MNIVYNFIIHYEGQLYTVKDVNPDEYCFYDMIKDCIAAIPGLIDKCTGATIMCLIPGTNEMLKVDCDVVMLNMFSMYRNKQNIHLFLTDVKSISQDFTDEGSSMLPKNMEPFNVVELLHNQPLQVMDATSQANNEVRDDPFQDEVFTFSSNDEYIVDENVASEGADTCEDSASDVYIVFESNGESNDDEWSENDMDGGIDGGGDKSRNYGGNGLKHDFIDPKRWHRDNQNKIVLAQGDVFLDVHEFRKVLREYVIQEGFEILREKNEKSRFTAICAAENCPWRIHASVATKRACFMIKTLNPQHTCIRSGNKVDATSYWIANHLFEELFADLNMEYELMYQQVNSKFGIDPPRSKLYRAKAKAKEMIEGKHDASYSLLLAYAELVMKYNLGSVFKLQYCDRPEGSTSLPRFKRAFLCFEACKSGFIKGCRPFLGLDGCHLKGRYGGVLLSAIALDGNNGLFPLACAVVEKECSDSWYWFMEGLVEVLGQDYAGQWLTFMSDKQKGLSEVIAKVFPMENQSNCCRHIYKNFKSKYPSLILAVDFWVAAKAYTEFEHKVAMKQLEIHDKEAHEWLSTLIRNQWSRHAYNIACKVDHVTNNMTESFNNWVGKIRSKPIIQIFEHFRLKLMERLNRRYQQGYTWSNGVCENVRKHLDMVIQYARLCRCTLAGRGEFQVKEGNKNFVVNLVEKRCDCLVWEHSGIPCKHAVVCIVYMRENIEDYCHDYFSKTCLWYPFD